MAERKRSKDGEQEASEIKDALGGGEDGAVGRGGGDLARDIATTDELKRVQKGPVGKTRVTKSKEEDD